MWPGLVGKGAGRRAADRPRHHARADGRRRSQRREVRRRRSVPVRPAHRHRLDRRRSEAARRQDRVGNLVVGSLVAPVWPPTGGGSAWASERIARTSSRRCARPAASPRSCSELGIRKYGIIRIDSANSPADWSPRIPTRTRSATSRHVPQAADIAESFGERLAAEGEICWGGMHSWKSHAGAARRRGPAPDRRLPGGHGAHPALHARLQRRRGRAPTRGLQLGAQDAFDEALQGPDRRPAPLDQSISTSRRTTPPSYGSGSHDKTGRHCPADDPNGKLDIARPRGLLAARRRQAASSSIKHICWDGCMFPNAAMVQP